MKSFIIIFIAFLSLSSVSCADDFAEDQKLYEQASEGDEEKKDDTPEN